MQGGGGGGCGRRRQCLGARRLGVRRLQQHASMHGRSSAAARRAEGRRRVWDAACGRGALQPRRRRRILQTACRS